MRMIPRRNCVESPIFRKIWSTLKSVDQFFRQKCRKVLARIIRARVRPPNIHHSLARARPTHAEKSRVREKKTKTGRAQARGQSPLSEPPSAPVAAEIRSRSWMNSPARFISSTGLECARATRCCRDAGRNGVERRRRTQRTARYDPERVWRRSPRSIRQRCVVRAGPAICLRIRTATYHPRRSTESAGASRTLMGGGGRRHKRRHKRSICRRIRYRLSPTHELHTSKVKKRMTLGKSGF